MGVNALASVWICVTIAILIMLARLVLGRLCRAKWDAGDSLTVVGIVMAMARICFTHIIVLWRTNNFDDVFRETHVWTEHEIYHREIGAKSVLVTRCLYISFLWIQKLVLLVFYRYLVRDMPWGKPVMRGFVAVFAATWVACLISTFVECRPFHLYWQVFPDPGNCSQAIVQLYMVGITNIFTDLMLIALPIPIILEVRLSLAKKFQLGFLFSIGLMIVVITAVRLPLTVEARWSETFRITWTSGEFLAATFVANAPKLYSFKHLLQRKKKKQHMARKHSKSGPHIRGRSIEDELDLEDGVMSTTIDVETGMSSKVEGSSEIEGHADRRVSGSAETFVVESTGEARSNP